MPREPVVWAHFAVAATVGNVVPFFLFGVGQLSIDSGLAGILNATTPLWTVTLALVARMERLTTFRGAGLLTGLAGALVIFASWRSASSVIGAAACLAASALYDVLFVYAGRYLASGGINPIVLSTGQLSAATVLSTCALANRLAGPGIARRRGGQRYCARNAGYPVLLISSITDSSPMTV